MFETFVLKRPFDFEDEKVKDAYMLEELQLFCDIDDHFKFNHSLSGDTSIGFLDIMLVSFLSQNFEFTKAEDI